MKRHMNYLTRALQSSDPRYARIFGLLGYPVPAGEIEAKSAERQSTEIVIPADWSSLHWSKQAKLAEEIAGSEDAFNSADGDTKAAKAKSIIEAELAKRGE